MWVVKIMKEKDIAVQGHRKRVMEKYQKAGFKSWYDYEILELALFYILPRVDTKPIAKRLVDKFGSINGIINAEEKYLQEIEGIAEYSITFLRFLRDFCLRVSEEKLFDKDATITSNILDSSEKVFQFLKLLIGAKSEEEFILIFLNNQNKVIAFETLAQGVANEVFVYPRKVVEKVLYYNAVAVILAHNHPSGDLTPSDFDIDFTNKIKLTLELMDIILLDHLIISNSSFFSFTEHGLNTH